MIILVLNGTILLVLTIFILFYITCNGHSKFMHIIKLSHTPFSWFLTLENFVSKSLTPSLQDVMSYFGRTLSTMSSQTWHLRIATTCLQRPPFWSPIFSFYNMNLPLNNDHLSTTATNFRSLRLSLYTSLTLDRHNFFYLCKSSVKFLSLHCKFQPSD